MPTTFNVISLGQLADMDTTEGNAVAENASALVGQSFGGPGAPLVDEFASFSRVGAADTTFDQDSDADTDYFSIDGGPAQTFDSVAVYNATITYTDGSTGSISAVVFQDVNGHSYLAPEFSANADMAALEGGAIRSISLDSLIGNEYSGLTASREAWNFVTCFVRGTEIHTAAGPVPIERLVPGDMIWTVDRGMQPLRWIGRRRVAARGTLAPILIRAGALGNSCDLRVSPQHRILLTDWRAEMYLGAREALAPAKHLVNGHDIVREPGGMVEYFHIMFDQHELVHAGGIASESFHPGAMAWDGMGADARGEILAIFPELRQSGPEVYGPPVRRSLKAHEARLLMN
ncbi:Hint domain-containing protein [Roseovarius pelagicus]|uniref:Hint domain-containing protein n=1 Tax=Roseovarius pelagicus TaxID=2980108 RepID=A0ABY6D9U4_9RHOB|nr:Hint domain-containing protein [Roseovarius pelagicus]UXX82729.1 Hint domain-containing protein [Roseovarius pelagicus]